MEPSTPTMTDHDLLIELKTTIGFIRSDIRDLKDSLTSRVTTIESDKIGRVEAAKLQADALLIHNDHETRLRALEKGLDSLITTTSTFQVRVVTWGSSALVILGLIEFAIQVYMKYH